MATLYFRVAADWQEVVRLREEIARLQRQLTTMGRADTRAISELEGRLGELEGRLDGLASNAAIAGSEFERLSGSFKNALGVIAGAASLKELATQIINVRGEMQQLEVAFSTMLGSKERAEALMGQLIRTAAVTPFGMGDVTNGAKQLLAYGIAAEEVNDTLVRLGDIAAGLSIPLGDLVYLYGTTISQGRMFTQDLRQFMGRGVPMAEALAAQFGVTTDKVGELVTAGKVGAEEFKRAIVSMTSEGGKFGGLMEAQSKTITGQISNIEDAIEQMFNKIGQSSEGIINGALSAVSALVENYEQVGRVLLGLVATYGTYKAAVMAVTAVHAVQATGIGALTAAETLHYGWLVLVEKAQKLLNRTMLANPYVLVATLIAGVVAAMLTVKSETERLREAQEKYQKQLQETIAAEEEHRRKMQELAAVAADESLATNVRREALNKLEQKYPDIFAKYDTELEKLQNIKKIKEEIAALEAGQSITNPEVELHNVQKAMFDMSKRDSGAKDSAAYKALEERERELLGKVRQNDLADIFGDLDEYSDEQLERAVELRRGLLALMSVRNADRGQIRAEDNDILSGKFGTFSDNYSRDELQYQLNKLQAEQKRRNTTVLSPAEQVEQLRKAWQEAQKAYDDFLDNTSEKMGEEEFNRRSEELKEAVETAKKAYDDKVKPGSKSSGSGSGDNVANERIRAQQQSSALLERLAAENVEAQYDAELAAEQEGTARVLRQIEIDYQKRIDTIREYAEELKALNVASGAETNADGLTDGQQAEIDLAMQYAARQRQLATEQAQQDEAEAMRQYLQQYGTFEQQRLAITEEYAEKIRRARTKGEQLSLNSERDAALRRLEQEAARRSASDIDRLMGSVDRLSNDAIGQLIERLEEYKRGAIDAFDTDALEKYQQQIDKLRGAQADDSYGPLSGFIPDGLKEELKLQQKIKDEQENLNALKQKQNELTLEVQKNEALTLAYIKNTTGQDFGTDDLYSQEGIESIMGLFEGKGIDTSKLSSMISGLQGLNTNLSGVTAAAGEAGTALQGMMGGAGGGGANAMAMVDTIVHGINDFVHGVSAIVDEVKDTMEALGKDTDVDTGVGKLSAGMQMFAEASQGATDAWDSFKSGNIAGVIDGVVRSFTSWIKGFARLHDAKHEKKIQDLQESIDDLDYAYQRAAKSAEDLYSKDASEQIKQNNELLRQQKLLIEQQIKEEEAKKDSDEARIKEWRQQIDEINDQLEENEQAAVDAIFGEDIKSAIENFAEAMADAWAEGEDSALSARDTVRKMMQNMVKESIKAALQSSKAMERIRSQLQAFYADDVLEQWEQDQIYKMAEQLQRELDEQFGWAQDLLEDDDMARSGSSRGIAQASQETIDELNGRATAIQGHTYSICENTKLLVASTNSILDSVRAIEANTEGLSSRMASVVTSVGQLRSTVGDLALKGIRIKN